MEQAQAIRDALRRVNLRRQCESQSPVLRDCVAEVKRLQSMRFSSTYADLATNERFSLATQFFLHELYGDVDFTNRDAQFFKVAGAMQRMLPRQALETVVMLAQLHALTEELDSAMGSAMSRLNNGDSSVQARASNYVRAWRIVDRRVDRERQLRMVLDLGWDLVRLTRTPGLRVILKLMHRPANAAGFGALQQFLEQGFDTFAKMATHQDDAKEFLSLIDTRERRFIAALFDEQSAECSAELCRQLTLAT